MDKIERLKRLKEEYIFQTRSPIHYASVGLFEEDNYDKWKALIIPPRDSPYGEGIFHIKILFPQEYPNSRPEIIFQTPIYLPNFDVYKNQNVKLGHLCIGFINNWRPDTTMREVLTKLISIFYLQNPCPHNSKAYDEFINNRYLFNLKAKYFTKKYVNPIISKSKIKSYEEKDWDFSCDEKDLESVKTTTISEKVQLKQQQSPKRFIIILKIIILFF